MPKKLPTRGYYNLDFVRERMSQIIEAKGLSDRKVSKSMGYNPSHLSDIMQRKNNPTLESVLRFCDFMGITYAEFFQTDCNNIVQVKRAYDGLNRVCGDRTQEFIDFLETADPTEFSAFLNMVLRKK